MKTLKTEFLLTLAAFGMSGGLFADAYPFTAGTAIPLKENDAQASWVTINNFELQNDHQVGNKQGTSSITLTLNNTSAGDYVFCFEGCNQSDAANLTVSVSGPNSYSRNAVITQVQTADGNTFRDSLFLLDDLPAGEFTFTLSAKQQNGTSWSGTYKNFTIKNLSGNALDMAESSGSAFAVKDQSCVKVLKNAGDLTLGEHSVGSTRNDDSVQFSLFSTNTTGSAKYGFSFDVATYDNYPTVTWRLVGPGVCCDRRFGFARKGGDPDDESR